MEASFCRTDCGWLSSEPLLTYRGVPKTFKVAVAEEKQMLAVERPLTCRGCWEFWNGFRAELLFFSGGGAADCSAEQKEEQAFRSRKRETKAAELTFTARSLAHPSVQRTQLQPKLNKFKCFVALVPALIF